MALKHVIWSFRICNYFCKIFKFRDFMNTLRNFAKFVFAHISAKFKYFVKQFILRMDHYFFIGRLPFLGLADNFFKE